MLKLVFKVVALNINSRHENINKKSGWKIQPIYIRKNNILISIISLVYIFSIYEYVLRICSHIMIVNFLFLFNKINNGKVVASR